MGYDQIPLHFLTRMLEFVAPVILHTFNYSIHHSIFPSVWKKGLIRPIPKCKNPSGSSDFRPRMVHHQMIKHLDVHNLLNRFQSGFRSGHSCLSALLKVTDDIQLARNNKMATILVLFDFSKAFDLVSHRVLLSKLQNLGFDTSAIDWFGSYLSDRTQCVLGAKQRRSKWMPVVSGVPQGSVLGPLLFSLYINDISSCFTSSSYHLYADDLQLYLSFAPSNINDATEVINSEINNLVEWSNNNGLRINSSKTKVLLIGNHGTLPRISLPSPFIQVNGDNIEVVDSARNLGIMFDSTLSWNVEVSNIRKKVFGALWSLGRLKKISITLH
ncbi:hypothetical protein WDU94_006590 [Cyamophila willieti]